MKVYSPSSTLNFMRCPRLWQIEKQGWRANRIFNNELAAAVGVGFAKGMEIYPHNNPDSADIDSIVEVAQKEALSLLNNRIAQGAGIGPKEEATYNLIPDRLAKAIRGFHRNRPLPSDWRDFITELSFPDYGEFGSFSGSRPPRADMLCQSDMGPCIPDFKTKVTAKDYIVQNFIEDFEWSWQMYHYVFAARCLKINVDSIAMALVIIEPFSVTVEQWMVDEGYMQRWLDSAVYWWGQMAKVEEGEGLAPMAGDHRDKYGLCNFKYHCCDGMPLEGNYIQLGKK